MLTVLCMLAMRQISQNCAGKLSRIVWFPIYLRCHQPIVLCSSLVLLLLLLLQLKGKAVPVLFVHVCIIMSDGNKSPE